MNQLVFQVMGREMEPLVPHHQYLQLGLLGLGELINSYSIHCLYKATCNLGASACRECIKNGLKLVICLDVSGCITK